MGEFDSDSDAEPSLPVARESSSSGVERQESSAAPSVSQSVSPETMAAESVTELLGRGHRTKKTNVKLRDYVVDAISAPSSSLSLVSQTPSPEQSSGTIYPIANYVSCDRFSPTHQQFLMAFATSVLPNSFKEAMQNPNWGNAVHKEYDSLEDLQT